MNEWWQALTLAQQIFYGIAIISSLMLLVQLVLGLIGADHGMADLDVGADHSSGLGIFSLQTIATFFVGFGWVGVIWLNRGYGLIWAVLCGLIVGGALMIATIALLRWLLRLQESGTLDYENAVGAVGTVYCPVPPRRGNGGQVEVVIQGRTVFADAITEAAEVIKTGAKVRVTSLLGRSTLVVEPC